MDDMLFHSELTEATHLLQAGKVAAAIETLERLRGERPEHVATAVNLGGAYILSGQFKKAVPVLEEVVERVPDDEMIWTNLGAAYLGNPVLATIQEQDRAIAAFERALQINPAAPNVAYNIGLIYRDRQDKERAIHWFTRAVQVNPNDRDARRILDRLQRPDPDTTQP